MKRTLALVLAAIALGAAKAPETTCWFAAGDFYATGLPTTYPFALTYEPYPTGTGSWSTDGTLYLDLNAAVGTRVFVWVRGHGPSLVKAGPALNDYHVIALCEAT